MSRGFELTVPSWQRRRARSPSHDSFRRPQRNARGPGLECPGCEQGRRVRLVSSPRVAVAAFSTERERRHEMFLGGAEIPTLVRDLSEIAKARCVPVCETRPYSGVPPSRTCSWIISSLFVPHYRIDSSDNQDNPPDPNAYRSMNMGHTSITNVVL